MILKLKSRKSRIKPGLFAFLLAERIIFGKKTQVYLPKMMQVRKKPGIPGFFRVFRTKKGPSRRDVFE